MSSKPVTVVTVNFDAGEMLRDCVASTLQSSVPVEIEIIDNASTDGSLDTLRSISSQDPRVRVQVNPSNLGFAAANNIALRRATGDYVLLLNPDCLVERGTIERVRDVLEEHSDAGMAGCLLVNPDGSEQAGCRRMLPTPARAFVRAFGLRGIVGRIRTRLGRPGPGDFVLADEPLPEEPVDVEAISGAFMLVRREAMERVGLLDEGYFLHCEDLDWCLRFRQAGYKILFVADVKATHEKGRCGRERPFRVQFHLHNSMVRYLWKHFRRAYPLPLTGLAVLGVWFRFGAIALPRAAWLKVGALWSMR